MADLALVGLMTAGFVLGYFRGAVRQLLALGVWLVAFLIAAHGRSFIADWLAGQWTQFSRPYVEMLSFAILFVGMFAIGVAFIQLSGTRTTLTQRESLDNLAGGVLGVGLVVLTVASLWVILATIYAQPPLATGQDLRWLRELYTAMTDSAAVGLMRETLIPAMGAVLGPFMPSGIRTVMG